LTLKALRELVLEAGLEVLDRDGLQLGVQSLSYAKVLDHLEQRHGIRMTRDSVHERIWPSHAEFRREVIGAAITRLPTDILGGQGHQLRSMTEAARRAPGADRPAELARRLGPAALEALRALPGFRESLVAKVVAAPLQDTLRSEVLHGPIRARSHSVLSTLTERLAAVTATLGLRPRAGTGLDRYTSHDALGLLMINLLTGSLLDSTAGADDEVVAPLDGFLGSAPDDDAPWTMVGIGLLAFLRLLFEPESITTGRELPRRPAPSSPPPPPIDPESGGRRLGQELRQIVLTAGVEVLLEERLDLRPESLAYASVFDHIEREDGIRIHRASLHNRIWVNHDAYWLEVLVRAIQVDPGISKPAVQELLGYQPTTRSDGSIHRRQMAGDVLRLMIGAEMAARRDSPDFQRRLAIEAALLTEPETELVAVLREAIRLTRRERVAACSAALQKNLVAQGLQVRSGLGVGADEAIGILTTLSLTAISGSVFDQLAGVEASGRRFRLARIDDPELTDPWTTPALAAWAVFDLLFEEAGGPTGDSGGGTAGRIED
jgi:hypothetical protein